MAFGKKKHDEAPAEPAPEAAPGEEQPEERARREHVRRF